MGYIRDIKGGHMPNKESRSVKLRKVDHDVLEELRQEVVVERGVATLSVPQLIMEMVKFYKENRIKS